MAEKFGPKGLDVVYVGAMETAEDCERWKKEYGLPFPVIPDPEGQLFRRFANGWVPFNLLVGPDGRVVFCENEFDEAGYSREIARLCGEPARPPSAPSPTRGEGMVAAPFMGASSDAGIKPAPTPSPSKGGGNHSSPQTIVILGGGTGGIVAAHHLRKRLPREHRIVLIDRSESHLFAPSLLWMMVGLRRAEQIRRPLMRLKSKGIEYHHGSVNGIDTENRMIHADGADIPYDHLVIALGAETAPESIPHFEDKAHNLYSVEGCTRLHEALESFQGGAITVLIPSMPFKCPAAPYEAAFLVEAFARRRGIRDKTDIHLLTPEHQPMPVAGKLLGGAIVEMLRSRGIHYHPLFTFKELNGAEERVVAADGQAVRAGLLIGIPPHRAPAVVREAGLAGVSGWIHVDPHTMKTQVDGVYAIGDVAAVKLPNGKMLPKSGVFAHFEAEVVAKNIAAEVGGEGGNAAFDGKGYCWVETGDGRAGFASGNFFAEPEPRITMHRPGRMWRWGKLAFEQWWLRHWF